MPKKNNYKSNAKDIVRGSFDMFRSCFNNHKHHLLLTPKKEKKLEKLMSKLSSELYSIELKRS